MQVGRTRRGMVVAAYKGLQRPTWLPNNKKGHRRRVITGEVYGGSEMEPVGEREPPQQCRTEGERQSLKQRRYKQVSLRQTAMFTQQRVCCRAAHALPRHNQTPAAAVLLCAGKGRQKGKAQATKRAKRARQGKVKRATRHKMWAKGMEEKVVVCVWACVCAKGVCGGRDKEGRGRACGVKGKRCVVK